jgi:hypothetical protein
MKKQIFGVGFGIATVLGAGSAMAEPFAAPGTFAVGVERVFGLDYTSETTKAPGSTVEEKSSYTSIALLGSLPTTMSMLPRLNFDVFLGPGISLGGGLMYQHVSHSQPAAAGSTTSYDSSTGIYLFAPRVGFGIPINENFAIWPRLGLAYYYTKGETTTTNAGVEQTSKNTTGVWYTTLDAMLMISPVQHVAISVGPSLDVLIGGPTTTRDGVGTPSDDTSQYSIGLRTGLTAWF